MSPYRMRPRVVLVISIFFLGIGGIVLHLQVMDTAVLFPLEQRECLVAKGYLAPVTDRERDIYNKNFSAMEELSRLGIKLRTSLPAEGELPRIIWTYWQTMPGYMEPPYVDLVFASWRTMNPTWDFRPLNFSQALDVVMNAPGSPFTSEAMFQKLTVQQRTDALRLALLSQFGGVWIDATLFCNRPLDTYVFEMVRPSGFSAPLWTPRAPCGQTYLWRKIHGVFGLSSHYLAAVRHSYIAERWWEIFAKGLFTGPCEGDPSYRPYYFIHRSFADMLDHDPIVFEKWDKAPRLRSSDTHSLAQGGGSRTMFDRLRGFTNWGIHKELTDEMRSWIDHPRAPVWKLNKGLVQAYADSPLRFLWNLQAEDSKRCKDPTYVCGFLRQRVSSPVDESLWGNVSYYARKEGERPLWRCV